MVRPTEKDFRNWSLDSARKERGLRYEWPLWQHPGDPEWGVVEGLRRRARAAGRRAGFMLLGVILVGLVGAVLLFAEPFGLWSSDSESARREQLRDQAQPALDAATKDLADLETRRDALRGEIVAAIPRSFYRDDDVAALTGGARLGALHVGADGSAAVVGTGAGS